MEAIIGAVTSTLIDRAQGAFALLSKKSWREINNLFTGREKVCGGLGLTGALSYPFHQQWAVGLISLGLAYMPLHNICSRHQKAMRDAVPNSLDASLDFPDQVSQLSQYICKFGRNHESLRNLHTDLLQRFADIPAANKRAQNYRESHETLRTLGLVLHTDVLTVETFSFRLKMLFHRIVNEGFGTNLLQFKTEATALRDWYRIHNPKKGPHDPELEKCRHDLEAFCHFLNTEKQKIKTKTSREPANENYTPANIAFYACIYEKFPPKNRGDIFALLQGKNNEFVEQAGTHIAFKDELESALQDMQKSLGREKRVRMVVNGVSSFPKAHQSGRSEQGQPRSILKASQSERKLNKSVNGEKTEGLQLGPLTAGAFCNPDGKGFTLSDSIRRNLGTGAPRSKTLGAPLSRELLEVPQPKKPSSVAKPFDVVSIDLALSESEMGGDPHSEPELVTEGEQGDVGVPLSSVSASVVPVSRSVSEKSPYLKRNFLAQKKKNLLAERVLSRSRLQINSKLEKTPSPTPPRSPEHKEKGGSSVNGNGHVGTASRPLSPPLSPTKGRSLLGSLQNGKTNGHSVSSPLVHQGSLERLQKTSPKREQRGSGEKPPLTELPKAEEPAEAAASS